MAYNQHHPNAMPLADTKLITKSLGIQEITPLLFTIKEVKTNILTIGTP